MPHDSDTYEDAYQECTTVWSIKFNGARDDLQVKQHVHVPEILRDEN